MKLYLKAVATFALSLGVFLAVAKADEKLREELLLVPISADLGGSATSDRADKEAYKQMAPNAGGMRFPQFMFGQRQFVSEWDPAPGQVNEILTEAGDLGPPSGGGGMGRPMPGMPPMMMPGKRGIGAPCRGGHVPLLTLMGH